MTDLIDEAQTQETTDDGTDGLIHTVCCRSPERTLVALCDRRICSGPVVEPSEQIAHEMCVVCEELDRANYCPIFGECRGRE